MNENNLVTKANTLITAHYSTSLEELRIIRTLISLVQPQDEDFKPYIFHISEFMDLLGIKDKSKYTEIPKITENLMRKIIKIREGKRLIQVAWLSSAIHDTGSGTVILSFDPNLKPYLLGLKELFTSYKLENILILTSKYSFRLYELLKSNEYKKTFEMRLDDLVQIFQLPTTYSDYAQIKRRVIEPAKKEINEKTDILFDYETITKRKKVTALKFTIKPNPKNKLKPDPDNKQLALLEAKIKPHDEPSQEDIEIIKTEFQRLYKAKLIDKFVKEMIKEKGLAHVQECLRIYKDYIKNQKIANIGGHFKTFVMEGYEKPVAYNGGNVSPMAQPAFFTATKKEAEDLHTKEKKIPSEAAITAMNSMYEMLGMHRRKTSTNNEKEETFEVIKK